MSGARAMQLVLKQGPDTTLYRRLQNGREQRHWPGTKGSKYQVLAFTYPSQYYLQFITWYSLVINVISDTEYRGTLCMFFDLDGAGAKCGTVVV